MAKKKIPSIRKLVAQKKRQLLQNHKTLAEESMKRYEVYKLLHFNGLIEAKYYEDPDWSFYYWCPPTVARTDLPKVRQLLGKMSVYGKEVCGDKASTLWINLQFADHPYLKLRYEAPLTGERKCKIVEQVSTYKTLVCES